MGSIAFLLDLLVELLINTKWKATEYVSRETGNPLLGYVVIVAISLSFTFVAAAITAYVAPAALGSGVAETMGIMNGVKSNEFISLKALFVKFFGVALAVSAGLCVGKEGPLVHMGAIVGCVSPYFPLGITKYFRNDFEKRKLMAVGVACGVSAAFGAPIGGALFAYELSKPNTFWSFSLTWKVFFASTIATFTLSLFKQLEEGLDHITVSSSEIVKLGSTLAAPEIDCLFGALVIGVIGGLLGAIFIRANNRINAIRKRLLNTKSKKVLEALFLTFLTVTFMYMAITVNYWAPGKEEYQTNGNFC
jgi:chloride channel 7